MSQISTFTFEEINLGQTAEFSVKLTDQIVEDFSRLSGDHNPLHMEESFAAKTPFNGRIVHGLLGVSYFSRLIGVHLPGQNALYLKQTSSFRSPMRIGMEIIIRGTVLHKTEVSHSIIIETKILNKEDETVLVDGQAVVNVTQ